MLITIIKNLPSCRYEFTVAGDMTAPAINVDTAAMVMALPIV